MRLGFFFYVLCSFLSLPFSYAKSPFKECPDTANLRLVTAYTFDDDAHIHVYECGNANRISFYRVLLTNFNAFEEIKLGSIPTVMTGTLLMKTDKHGEAGIDIVPESHKREYINLDFDFTRNRRKISLGVSKFIPRPEGPAASAKSGP